MMYRTLVLSLILIHGFAWGSTAEAEKQVRAAVDEVLAVAHRAGGAAELARGVRPVLEQYISFEAMTRRAVGPGWRTFSKAQQSESTKLFTTLVIRNYTSKFTPGELPAVEFKPATSPAAGRVEVPTIATYKGSKYVVTYRLEQGYGWKITDIVIEGVSLIANYRTQFDAQFKSGGAEAVVNALKRSVNEPK